MHTPENLRNAKPRILAQSSDEDVDQVIERGSPGAWLSTLLAAAVIAATLWFGDFASESARPAWAAIEHAAIALRYEVGISQAHAGSG
ncbi:hypothetical protein SAMN05444161_6387 [Rhizobiales bacterium GAS191]|jgi:hypothetical protein|nr:hypothetical protein SAMN05519103_05565 [Rhizobiales bacterium GAS113]SED88285.1 hypothetical protein SAMN05519104_4640 [Rhizobiales bacterium GAS188]SEE61474.1 hypothetical protein SAMN05444161_6387 [Rhizobiales bacterium GAS191]